MKLLIDDAVPYAQAIFSHLGNVTLMPGRDITQAHLKETDALIVRSRTQVNAQLLDNTPVQFVGSTVVGLDHIDQDYLRQKNITFYSAQGCNANSVAEYVITALFAMADQKSINLFPSDRPLSLGIIGVGHVGSALQRKAQALGWTLLLNDPYRADAEPNFPHQPLETLLQADIISVHTPLTHTGRYPSYHLLHADHLKKLQPHQILINAARGGIIDEQAWPKTQTATNIIDCWQNEPNIATELYQKADLATPHIAGHSLEAKVAGSVMVYQQLCKHWQKTPQNDWQTQLPPVPQWQTAPPKEANLQQSLHHLFQQAYPILEDDRAIRHKDIHAIHQAFEDYRRHYPIRREWHQYPTPELKANVIEIWQQLAKH